MGGTNQIRKQDDHLKTIAVAQRRDVSGADQDRRGGGGEVSCGGSFV